ncbi:MAG: protein meaA [Alphaproteobacteria bacterium]|nr:protein meaA [Alphaproteobacteria bacterium]
MTDKLADAQKSTATVSPVPARDRPWMFRTYSGHSSAKASNALYRTNLERGQTGLSIAFDLPTQTGYDGDHVLAKGEVGKVGVPVSHLGDMEALFEGLPLDRMNTSMTINAPAAWMLSLYIALGERQGVARADLQGTTQNDIIKEYLSRGPYIFPPDPSLKLTADVASFTYREVPKWNPLNVCSYHLQEAGATPEQELSFALATAIAVLDAVRDGGQVPEEDFARVVGRISFFVNSGIRIVTELSKMRAFAEMWDDIARNRYGVTDEKLRRFRYGVQVNSLGLTEQQPENNVYRILLEMLPVVLSRNARARAVQLPAWNEALGLPRPWDQHWSLRLQQIVAYETDLLEFGDIFDGSRVIAEKVEQLKYEAEIELKQIENMGGAVAAIENSYMKRALVSSNAQRLAAIESGDQTVIGVNKFTEAETSPLTASDGAFLTIDGKAEEEQIALLQQWRAQRDSSAVKVALEGLATAARDGSNIMEPSIAAAHAGVTTGEWAETLRGVFGEFRAPTGVSGATGAAPRDTDKAREHVQDVSEKLGRRMKMLLGKPGLDGHSNGAEQIAVRARDAGVDVVYEGIRLTPRQIVSAALEEGVHVIGLSILSGSHATLAGEVMSGLKEAGLEDVPVIVGGIIPEKDAEALLQAGISRVYTPKDFDLGAIIDDIAGIVENANNL